MAFSISSLPVSGHPRHQRKVRNYLLDAHFQLKYTGLLVVIAGVISLVLGTLLWSASRHVLTQSQLSVRKGQETVQRGEEVVRESQNLSAVVRMNIVNDPTYASNPELIAMFNQGAREQERQLHEQQKNIEADAVALQQRASELAQHQQQIFYWLVGAFVLLVLAIGAAGIVVTHRIAGPVFKMKRLLREVGNGNWALRERLRRGDELHHFFRAFEKMVESLRTRQLREIEQLEEAIGALEHIAPAQTLASLYALRAEMRATLEG